MAKYRGSTKQGKVSNTHPLMISSIMGQIPMPHPVPIPYPPVSPRERVVPRGCHVYSRVRDTVSPHKSEMRKQHFDFFTIILGACHGNEL